MNKTLKVYDDGSKLTVLGLGIALSVAAIASTGWVMVQEWKVQAQQRKWAKKWDGQNEV